MPATRLAATLRRRLLAELGQGYPTRRRIARCGRLVQAALEAAPMAEPPPATTPMIPPACPVCATCSGTDLYASRARPGLHRCRRCGTEIT
jgi:hypothetical protein